MNLSTGVPAITIPLYEITSGGFKIPVTLSYHAAGNKVTDLASWAGLGWSIDAGGEISRRVQGGPDDNSNGYLHGHLRDASTISPCTNNDDVIYLISNSSGEYDALPDIFSYNFPGADGKFFLNGQNNYQPTLIPFAPVKVNRNPKPNDPSSIASFNITDDHGNIYDFGTTGAIENTNSFSGGVSTQSQSAWMLERMLSQDRRDTVFFNYVNSIVTTPPETSESLTVDDAVSSVGLPSAPNPYFENKGTLNPVSYEASTVNEKQINSILFKNGKVLFHQSDADRQDLLTSSGVKSLKDIQVYAYDYKTKAYQLLKTIKFFQSYFIKDNDATTQRLRLDSIQILNAQGLSIQHYRFEYNPLPLPKYTTFGKDYWGYYNGKDGQSSLIPQQTVEFSNSGAGTISTYTIGSDTPNGRDPDSVYMQASILTKIFYPTGGYTTFKYQTNQYRDTDGSTKLAGGLRVTSVNSFDGVSPYPLSKTYQYYSPVKNFVLNNYFFTITRQHKYWAGSNDGEVVAGRKRSRIFMSAPTNQLLPWDGSPVTYTQVVEYQGNGVYNSGKSVYNFTWSNDLNAARATEKPLASSFFFLRGLLLSKSIYKHLPSNNYQIVERETHKYTAFPLTWYNNVGIASVKQVVNEGGAGGSFMHDAAGEEGQDCQYWQFARYDIPSDDNYQISKVVNVYDQNDTTKFTTDTVKYYYDNIVHQQVTREVHTDSRNKVTASRVKFPADYIPSGGSGTGNAVLDKMLEINMQAFPIESWDTLKNATAGIISGQVNSFSIAKGKMGAVVPDKILKLGIIKPLSDFTPSGISGGQLVYDNRYIQKISFDAYDTKNNLTRYTVDTKTPTRIIWDYLNDLPIAEVVNSPDTAAYTSFEADGKGNWAYSGVPIADNTAPSGNLAYNLSSGSVTFNALNNTKPYSIYYWSKTGSASVNGSTGTMVMTNSKGWSLFKHSLAPGIATITMSGNVIIDELRMYADGAQMKTYTYRPLIGIGDITDAKENTQYFEYDDFQRLSNVRDTHGNIIKNVAYNYAVNKTLPQEIFLSAPAPGTFTRTNCGTGQIGSQVSYTEPYGKFTSTISQADADQQAQNALAIDGPNYANTTGTCRTPYLNAETWHDYQKNNCGVGLAGSTVRYTVPLGTYSSLISQDDADQQAQNDIAQNGQTYANNNGSCPNGTDIAQWHISASVPSSTGHTINVTVTRPAGDINNVNTANIRIPAKSFTGIVTMPSGSTSVTKTFTFATAIGTSSVSVFLDSIN
ncbi:DUF5977 domain-containing protein [Mucilaginibacter sp. SG564]|uniref:DUF5977 domain-containing protein n=1 Tax=Mucilaginibacter sp. SG564 TaxID=2587022 RepID=UPI001555E97E|nr:hypothetical protein [Mucilaginibacter sp. SG564]